MTETPVRARRLLRETIDIRPGRSSTGSWSRRLWVTVGVVAFVVLIRLTAPDIRLYGAVGDVVTLALSVIVESLPYVNLGLVLSVTIQVWLPRHLLRRVLPRSPVGRRAALSLLGVLFPVCECGNVPLGRGLLARG